MSDAKKTYVVNDDAPEEGLSLNAGLADPSDDDPDAGELALAQHAKYLQNDDIFQAPIEAGKLPELKEDVKIVAAECAALEDLFYLIEDVRQSGGMSRSFAQEAQRIDADLITVPLGYFTLTPTKTRLQVSMESFVSKVWEFIKSIFKKIVEMVKKAIAWLTGKPSEKEEDPAAIAEEEESAKRMEAIVRELSRDVADSTIKLAQATKEGVTIRHRGQTAQYSQVDEIIKATFQGQTRRRYMEIIEGKDGFYEDFIYKGQFYQRVMEAEGQLGAWTNYVLLRTKSLRKILDKFLRSTLDESDLPWMRRDIAELSKPIPAVFAGRHMTLRAYHEGALYAFTNIQESATGKQLVFEDVFLNVAQAFEDGRLQKLNLYIQSTLSTLASCRQESEGILKDVAEQGDLDLSMRTDLDWHKAIGQYMDDVAALASIASLLKMYRTRVLDMTLELMKFGRDAVEVISQDLPAQHTSEQFKRVTKLLLEDLTDFLQTVYAERGALRRLL